MGEHEHNKGRATMRLNALRNRENRCRAHAWEGRDPQARSRCSRHVHRSEWQTHPWGNLGSAGLQRGSELAKAGSELGQSCESAKAEAKLPRSCLEARYFRVYSFCLRFPSPPPHL